MKIYYILFSILCLWTQIILADDFLEAKKDIIGGEVINNKLSSNSVCNRAMTLENSKLYSDEKIIFHAIYLNCQVLSIKFGFEFLSVDSNLNFCQKDQFAKDFSDTIYKLKNISKSNTFSHEKLEKIKDWTFVNSFKYRELCTDKVLNHINPEGLVNNTGLPPNSKNESYIQDDSRQNKKNGAGRGPGIPEIQPSLDQKSINK